MCVTAVRAVICGSSLAVSPSQGKVQSPTCTSGQTDSSHAELLLCSNYQNKIISAAGRTVPCERSFTSYAASLTCVSWLMLESWKKAMLLRKLGLLVPCGETQVTQNSSAVHVLFYCYYHNHIFKEK